MQRLHPTAPSLLEDCLPQVPRHEWILPSQPRKNLYGVFKKLPAGKPDCLHVSILHFEDGIERCTAAVYGERAYVIHYEFKRHVRRSA